MRKAFAGSDWAVFQGASEAAIPAAVLPAASFECNKCLSHLISGSLMVILQVQDFALLDVERNPPIAADGNAPGSGAVALELVNAPSRRTGNRIHIRGRNEHCQNVAEPLYEISAKLAGIVILNETQKSAMLNASDNHNKSLPFKVLKPPTNWFRLRSG
jgi:hypothetical protein